MPRSLLILCLLLAAGPVSLRAYDEAFELPPINYSETEPDTQVEALRKELDAGTFPVVDGSHESEKAFLRAVLDFLGVPVESQVLVFSKTSLQNGRISPHTPRAIYYSAETYVGWVPDGDIEIIALDPKLGPIFYLLKIPHRGKSTPTIERSGDCLSCHAGSRTRDLPGMLVRSVYPKADGFPISGAGSSVTTAASPISTRWGGWYVTGDADGPRHLGNLIFSESDNGNATIATDHGDSLKTLDGILPEGRYLRNRSDIVALMVLEHQAPAHNALIHGNYMTRQQIFRSRELVKALGGGENELTPTTLRVIDHHAEKIVAKLLFANEFQLEGYGVEGDPGFQQAFMAGGRKTPDGHSLREFELLSRIFKYRCSYLIHSSAFANLVPELKAAVWQKLLAVLNGTDTSEQFAHLRPAERARIKEILTATAKDLPEDWK